MESPSDTFPEEASNEAYPIDIRQGIGRNATNIDNLQRRLMSVGEVTLGFDELMHSIGS